MKVKELKAALEDLGLSTKGNKEALEARLAETMAVEEEEEVVEELPEEEVVEELPEEVPAEEPEEVSDCECSWCANGYSHREEVKIEKRPDTPSMEWNLAKYGKKPNGAYVRFDGVHMTADGNKIE